MNYLRQILKEDESSKVRLDRAALEIASIQFPGLEAEPFLDQLNELASRLGDRLRNFNDGRDFVEKAQSYLFEELGFRGNEEDYFDPANSCLNQVLEKRIGLPITLSVFYMEVARRLAMPVYGVGLPRHFIVEFDDGRFSTYVDPFNGGRVITAQECYVLAGSQSADPALLRRASKKQIAMRMLMNLQGAYLRRNDWARAVDVLDLLILGTPASAPDLANAHKRRGLMQLELKRFQAARQDLDRYLTLSPDAPDRDEIRKQLEAIHRWLARVN